MMACKHQRQVHTFSLRLGGKKTSLLSSSTSSVAYVNSAFVVAGGWAKECVGILDKESKKLRDGKLMRCSVDRFHG
jgi:hypothetical protein